ncbi:MAG: thiamine ABC transporter substrate-binding protein, partial [Candidatus Asgardarchaeia archaeon]
VQKYFALNNWMYPANFKVELPEVYQYAINPDDVLIANLLISKEEISENLSTWLEEWQTIMVS